MNPFRISVITITFNNHAELLSTVQSLAGQQGIQHVVVNGGKDPATIEFLQNYTGKSVSERDQGISDAFNKGLRLADGDAVVYLNSGDTLCDPSYYAEAAALLQRRPDVGYVHADIRFIDKIAGALVLKPDSPLPRMPFTHPSLIVRKELIDRLGGFDLTFRSAMDLDFAYRLVKSGAQGVYLPRVVVEMDGSGVSSAKPWLGFREKVRAVIKNNDVTARTCALLGVAWARLLVRISLEKLGLHIVISGYRKKKYL